MMLARLFIAIGLVLAAYAVAFVVAAIRDRHELRHHEDHCTGVWLPWPSLARPWLRRCDRCMRAYLATPHVRELATRDLETAQRLRALTRQGEDALRRERERAS